MSKPAELYACLLVEQFPAQTLLRLRPGQRSQPAVVLEGSPPQEVVCALNSHARALGAEPGMTRVELDTLPSIQILLRSPSEEATARTALLECAGGFSPRLEDRSSDRTFIGVLDISGTEKLFGPPQKLAATLLKRANSLGISPVVAVSCNLHAAVSLAKGMSRKERIQVIPCGKEREALAPLPFSVLELSADQAHTFRLWGIHNLGMLGDLPQRELIARMGQDGNRLQRLARGEFPHLFQPIELPFSLEERIELDSPVELLDSLLFVASLMLEQLILRATARVLALAEVTIALTLEGGNTHSRTVRLALPTNDRHLWLKLLHLDLEAHPPNAAILACILKAEPGKTSKVQLGLFAPQAPEPGRLDVTLARITKIVGEGNVGRAVLCDTHGPESFRVERFVVPTTEPKMLSVSIAHAVLRAVRPAESVLVSVEAQKPKGFQFRQERYVVERAFGPWSAGGEWWNSSNWHHEQWDLKARSADGSVLYCCLVRDFVLNQWQMVGIYD
jgi:protein ImuB